jgi:hexosaminidase
MNIPSWVVCTFTLALAACSPIEEREVTSYELIPQPAELNYSQGQFILTPNFTVVHSPELEKEALFLKELLENMWGASVSLLSGLKPEEGCVQLLLDASLTEEEAYLLEVSQSHISISAGSDKGVFYGIQSLRQMIEPVLLLDKPDRIYLKTVTIKDAPRFKHRGMLLDCCRHFMEVDFVKRYIDLLSQYKMNVLHWHLTEDQGWRIAIDAYPKLTEVGAWRTEADSSQYGGFYSKDQIRDIVSYAQERKVMIIPEIELPGHSTAAIAAYPWLSCTGDTIPVQHEWGVFQDIYCAGQEETFEFMETVLLEVIELFPAPYIHIGGDEAPKTRWEVCTHCQQRIATVGLKDEHELQSWFIERIGKFLEKNDRQIIGWDEILDGGIPEGAIVQSWRGMQGGITAATRGHEVVMSPTSHAYFDYGVKSTNLEQVYHFDPVPTELSEKEASLVRGGECNMWTEHAPQHLVDSKMFPRILAMAEVLWTPLEVKDYSNFYERVQNHYLVLDAKGVTYGMEALPIELEGVIEEGAMIVHAEPHVSGVEVCQVIESDCVDLPAEGIKVNGEMELEFRITRSGKPYGDNVLAQVHAHRAIGLPVRLENIYSPYYTGGGEGALTDGFLGSMDFRDGHWQALQENDMAATIDLGEMKNVRSMSSRFYFYNNAWIFLPEEVSYYYSIDGVDWKLLESVAHEHPIQSEDQAIIPFATAKHEAKARYIRMKAKNIGFTPHWHDAPNEPAWLFCDEFVVLAD